MERNKTDKDGWKNGERQEVKTRRKRGKEKPKKNLIKDKLGSGLSFITMLSDLTSRHFQTIYLTYTADVPQVTRLMSML